MKLKKKSKQNQGWKILCVFIFNFEHEQKIEEHRGTEYFNQAHTLETSFEILYHCVI